MRERKLSLTGGKSSPKAHKTGLRGERLLREGNLSNLLEIFQKVYLAIVPERVGIGISKVKCSARAETPACLDLLEVRRGVEITEETDVVEWAPEGLNTLART